MSLARVLYRSIVTVRYAVPIAVAVVGLCAWWGLNEYGVARQIERHEPTATTFTEAVVASRHRELYARFSDATLDCGRSLSTGASNAYALVDSRGQVAAMIEMSRCDDRRDVEGLFIEPPHGLYGAAIESGWNVTLGHLAFLKSEPRSADAWQQIAIAAFIALMSIASVLSLVKASHAAPIDAAWRNRGIGFALLGAVSWLAYMAHDYVYFGFLSVPIVCAFVAIIALAMISVPRHRAIVRLSTRLTGEL